ncbi:hypothetical protein K8R43_06060 [archaeon]|nr:hypothetical protein [archaeon]
MHKVVHAEVGGTKIPLLKVTGSLIVFAAGLGVLDSVASIFRLMKQLEIAQADANFALQVFNLPSTALSSQVILGYFMGPIAVLLLWVGLACVGTLIHRSGRLFHMDEEVSSSRKR